jgi:hypothetical protein
MARSDLLRVEDVRDAYRVIGENRDNSRPFTRSRMAAPAG